MPAKPTSDSAVSDDIFELTDIVERGNLDVADADLDAELGSDLSPSDDASFEQELEDLFSEDGADSSGKARGAAPSDDSDDDITDLGDIAEPVASAASADDDLDFDAMIEQAAASDDGSSPKGQDLLPELEEELDFSDIDLDEALDSSDKAQKSAPSKDPFEDFDLENLDISDADTDVQNVEEGLDVESFFDDDLDLGDKDTGAAGGKKAAVDDGFDLVDIEPAGDKKSKKITAPDAFDLEGLDSDFADLGMDDESAGDIDTGQQEEDTAALAESLDDFDLDGLEEELDGLDLDGGLGEEEPPAAQGDADDGADDLFDGLDLDDEPKAKAAAPKAASKPKDQESLDFDDLDDVLGDFEDSLEGSPDGSLEDAGSKVKDSISTEDFDLDGLDDDLADALDDLGLSDAEDEPAKQKAAPAKKQPAAEADDLEDLGGLDDIDGLDGLDALSDAQTDAVGDLEDADLDGLDDDLADALDDLGLSESEEKPAKQKAAPAKKQPLAEADTDALEDLDDLDDLGGLDDLDGLDGLDALADAQSDAAGDLDDADLDGLDDDLADALDDLGLSESEEKPAKQKAAPAKKQSVAEADTEALEDLDDLDDLGGLDDLDGLDGFGALSDAQSDAAGDLGDADLDGLDDDLADALDDLGLSESEEKPAMQKAAPAKKQPMAEADTEALEDLDDLDDLGGLDDLDGLDGLDALSDAQADAAGDLDDADLDGLGDGLDDDLADALDDLGLSESEEKPAKQKAAPAKKQPVAEADTDALEDLDDLDDLGGLDDLDGLDGLDALSDAQSDAADDLGDADLDGLDGELDSGLDDDLADALDDLELSEPEAEPAKQKAAPVKKQPAAEAETDALDAPAVDTDFDLEGALEGLDLSTEVSEQGDAAGGEPLELDALPVEHISGADQYESELDTDDDLDADEDIMSVTLPDEDESGSDLFAEEGASYEDEDELVDEDIDISGLNELIEDLNLPDEDAGDIGDELDDSIDEDLDEQPGEEPEDVFETPELAAVADDEEFAALTEPAHSASEEILPAGDEDDLDIDDIDTSDLDLILQEVEADDLSGGVEPVTEENDPDSLPFELHSEDEEFQELLQEDSPAVADLPEVASVAAAAIVSDASELLAEEADELMTDMDGAVHSDQQYDAAEQETLEADRSLKAPPMVEEGPLLVESDTEDLSLHKQSAGNGSDDFDQRDIDAAFSRSAVAALHDIQEIYGKIDGLELQLAKASDTEALAQRLEDNILQKVDALLEDRLAARIDALEQALEEKYQARLESFAEKLEQQLRERLMAEVEEKLQAGELLYEKIAEGLRPEIAAALQQYGSRFVQHSELSKSINALQEELDRRIAKAAPAAAATVIREELAALIKEGLL